MVCFNNPGVIVAEGLRWTWMDSSERDELGGWKGDRHGWASLEGMN